jgi:nucleotide-binding universal stress UspA family protein
VIALTNILVPTNLGAPSKAAVRYGVALARQFGARLFLLHAMNDRDFEAAVEAERVLEELAPSTTRGEGPNLDDVVKTVARADLQRLLSPEEERDTRADYQLRPFGPAGPHTAIVACARDLSADLIIMGKHTLGRVEHLIAGSVTERVIREAPCPVMIVQHPQRDFVVHEPGTE